MATRVDKRRRQQLDKDHVVGLPQLRFVQDLVSNLRLAYDHPNRKLFLDDLVVAMLLAFYNPVVRSLRGVEDASQMPGINQHLHLEAIKRSTAVHVASPLRLLTSVQDESVPAWMIGQVYRRRWDIELFFRWLKTCAAWEHLISESRNGMLMQFCVALIGTLLLAACTGRKPDRYSFNLLSLAAAGLGTVDDALAILKRRHAERDRDRQRRLERSAKKSS